ncbi:MAG: hypothetical protein LOY00_09980, partial [Methylocaldum sp.]|nr:hypothetical protein [Methylocaldum sp.]
MRFGLRALLRRLRKDKRFDMMRPKVREAYFNLCALIAEDFRAAFEQCDVLVSPTTPTTAFRIGERVADPMAMYMADL